MSAKTTKKVSNISSKPNTRATGKARQKLPVSRSAPVPKAAVLSGKAKAGKTVPPSAKPSVKVPARSSAIPVKRPAPGGKLNKSPAPKHGKVKPTKPVQKPAQKPASKPLAKPAAKPATKAVQKSGGKPQHGKLAKKPLPLKPSSKAPTRALAGKPASKPAKPLDKKSLAKAQQAERVASAKAKEAEKKLLAKTKEAEKRAADKAKEAEKKAKAAEKQAREKEAKALALAKKQETEQKKQETERKKAEAERQRAALELQKKRDLEQKARDAEKARVLAEKEAAREAARLAAEADKERKLQERENARLAKEQEKAQLKALRDAEREEARRLKDEEKAKRDAEREAYRKAKEAEREKLRAVKEAARRALEGRIAEATRNANKLGGGRSTTTRIYSPRAIPDQSGTTRRVQGTIAMMGVAPTVAANILAPTGGSEPPDFGSYRHAATSSAPPAHLDSAVTSAPEVLESSEPSDLDAEGTQVANRDPSDPSDPHFESSSTSDIPNDGLGTPSAQTTEPTASSPPEDDAAHAAERVHPSAENTEERYRAIEERLKHVPEAFRRDYQETIDMSWIHHDSALEGVVYTFQELKAAIDPGGPVVTDSSMQPVVDEIRRHKAAIDLVRDLGERKRAPITVDTVKKIYITLHPEEGDVKTVKYRRDIPQHRLYFHEYSHPEKIPQKVRQVIDWLNGPEPKKLKSPIRVAARVHYELLRAFPFQNDSGKVARLVMNLILIRAGHPPAIIHSTERQRYYETLKGALPVLVQMVTESILNALASIEKLLDEQESKLRA